MNITGINSIYNMPFDQYQRYKTTSLIVENIRKNKHSFCVLEIGANEHKNLERFLPNDSIKYLDIQLPEYLQKDENYILADATNMPEIEDNSFDIVIALDVFEHIPQNLRNDFLSELNRVSKELVILAGPFDEDGVAESEIEVNEYYKSKYGEDYIWLKEHIENKLPDLDKTLKFIKNDLQCYINHFSHGSLELWEKFMSLYLVISDISSLYELKRIINYIYNKTLYIFDFDKRCYRNFLVFAQKNIKMDIEFEINTKKTEEFKILLEKWKYLLKYENNLPNSQLQIAELWKRVNESEKKLEEREEINQELWKRVNESEKKLKEREEINQELWKRVNESEKKLEKIYKSKIFKLMERLI